MRFFYILNCLVFLICLDATNVYAQKSKKPKKSKAPKVADIDLSHWKVTLPIGDPIEVEPPEIHDYANNKVLKPFMHNDSTDGSIVFYCYPAKTTRNTKYSRTELREQMVPGSNHTNWTFKEGGHLKATMSVPDVSKGADGKFHRTIIMQIHGRLTNEQRDLIGEDDNNAPPILKIYWDKGKIRVKTKVLKDPKAPDEEILSTDAWTDDAGYNFETPVDHKKFTLEVIASDGRLEVKLNGFQKAVYKGKHIERWGIFENYFKVGNYLNTRDKGAYAKVKLYDLEVNH
ncbi:MAG: polysaccharide lyase family 7 protein [Bacteroidota bacterium]